MKPIASINHHLKTIVWISTSCCYWGARDTSCQHLSIKTPLGLVSPLAWLLRPDLLWHCCSIKIHLKKILMSVFHGNAAAVDRTSLRLRNMRTINRIMQDWQMVSAYLLWDRKVALLSNTEKPRLNERVTNSDLWRCLLTYIFLRIYQN